MRQTLHLLQTCQGMHFVIFLHVRCRGPGGVGRGSWPTKTPLPNPVKTYLPVSALGPSAGSWGIQSSSFSSPFHFVLCHSWCLAQRGHDPYPHGSFHLVLGMPFRRSGIHGTKNFISFVVIITITTFIIFTISSSCSTRQGRICTGKRCHPNCVSVCVCVCLCLCVCVCVCLSVCLGVVGGTWSVSLHYALSWGLWTETVIESRPLQKLLGLSLLL